MTNLRAALRADLSRRPDPRRAAAALVLVASTLFVATVVVGLLEGPPLRIPDASPVYFVAIALVGSLLGTWPALATAVGAFVVYDLLFTAPQLTLVVQDPREWLDLVVFLVLAVFVGRLAALGTERAAEASTRATEATALFSVGRLLATTPDVETAAPLVADRLLTATGLRRVWIVADRGGNPRILADTGAGEPIPTSPFVTALVRMPGETPAHWQRAHDPLPGPVVGGHRSVSRTPILRVRMEADGVPVGSIKGLAGSRTSEPDRSATRLLALAADQLGLAVRRDALRREATEVEIARQADALKGALLDAVSHDLRTPLASIRAQAGVLTDRAVPIDLEAARTAGAAIDAEAERLDRLVREVLDLSRVDSGTLRPELEAIDLADAVRAVVDRLRPLLGSRAIEIAVADDLPPARADALLLDGILSNLIENVARHAASSAAVRISAGRAAGPADDPGPAEPGTAPAADTAAEGRIELAVEDGGPGVPTGSIGRLFERFDRLPPLHEGSRRGLGLGLSIVRGFAEAMDATVRAEASELGGLRVVVVLPAAAALTAEDPR